MLSPSMMANSYGNTLCDFHICCAVSTWARSPVPLSPMTEELDRVFAHRRQRRGRGRHLRRRLALLQIQRVDRHHDRQEHQQD